MGDDELIVLTRALRRFVDIGSSGEQGESKSGYKSEGEACFVFTSAAAGRVPLHRLFNPQSGDHFYATSDAERNNAVTNLGYQNEGEACFIFAADPAGVTPLYRLYHAFL